MTLIEATAMKLMLATPPGLHLVSLTSKVIDNRKLQEPAMTAPFALNLASLRPATNHLPGKRNRAQH